MSSKISHSTIFGAPAASASSTFAAGAPLYAFGHSERELKRLTTQSRLFDPFTRRMFEQAGLTKGMRWTSVAVTATSPSSRLPLLESQERFWASTARPLRVSG